MKILRISRSYPPNFDGTAFHVYELSKCQAVKGSVFLYQPHKENIHQSNSFNIYSPPFCDVFIKHNKIYKSKVIILIFHFFVMIDVILKRKKLKFDIIHCHNDIFDVFWWIPFSWWTKVPLILTVHAGLNQSKLYTMIARRIFANVDRIICVSKKIEDELVNLGIHKSKIFVISSGIDLEGIKLVIDEFSHQPAKGKKVVTVGRLDPMKNFGCLIDAFKQLDLHDISLTIIGDGMEREILQQQAKDDPRIIFTGAMSREEIYRHLARSDLFVMSSIKLGGQEEGTPTAMMEALGAGLPIITTNSGGIAELLKEYPLKWIVPQNDSKKLAEAMVEFFHLPDFEKDQLKKISRQIAQKKDWSIIAEKVGEVYKDVLFPSH
ncbi:MAG: glycosyltransferase family 4 protein [SAR324 cluster bacterium]|nr:glycosyltransferase family 4 protein [SAR324 cluster bacterium]